MKRKRLNNPCPICKEHELAAIPQPQKDRYVHNYEPIGVYGCPKDKKGG